MDMGDSSSTGVDPRKVQEDEYRFPYHYVPDVKRGRVVYALSVDWAADYLSSMDIVRHQLKQSRARTLCDFGCGDGRMINELAPEFPEVEFTGLELSERALAFARLFANRSDVAFLSSAASPDASFDLVTCIEVFEHIPLADADAFLRSAWSRVRPGGTLLLTVPHANIPVHAKHFRHFTGETLEASLRQGIGAGIDELRLGYVGRVERGLSRLFSKLARNRLMTIEPLFQWRLKRRLRVEYLPEAKASRVVAVLRRAV